MELVEGSTTDVEFSERIESNYMAVLHWYDNDGTHRKLDVRRIIRKSLRKVCTNTTLPAYLRFDLVALVTLALFSGSCARDWE